MIDQATDNGEIKLRRLYSDGRRPQFSQQLLNLGKAVLMIGHCPAKLRRVYQKLHSAIRHIPLPFGNVQHGFQKVGMALSEPAGDSTATKAGVHPLSLAFSGTLSGLIDHHTRL
ncbi:hypothetical protein [Oceanimonas doudoroffii]|uniref:hypothetical protein n=1 Tax=Oceanimonas doudoroffii TaxID=84158 RepID=UPI00146F2B4F|nr:hypothetical protein [Oceanimonas doudoroffii]